MTVIYNEIGYLCYKWMTYCKVSVDSSGNQDVAGSVHRYNLEVLHCPTQEIARYRKSVIEKEFFYFLAIAADTYF